MNSVWPNRKKKTNSQHKFQNLISTVDKRMDHTLETCILSVLTRNYSFQSIHLQYYHYYYYEESFGENTLNSGKVLCSGQDSKALI